MATTIFSRIRSSELVELVIDADLEKYRVDGRDKNGNALYRCLDGCIRDEKGFRYSTNSLVKYARKYNVPVTINRPAPQQALAVAPASRVVAMADALGARNVATQKFDEVCQMMADIGHPVPSARCLFIKRMATDAMCREIKALRAIVRAYHKELEAESCHCTQCGEVMYNVIENNWLLGICFSCLLKQA